MMRIVTIEKGKERARVANRGSRTPEPGAGVRSRQSAAGEAAGEIGAYRVDRPAMERSLNAFAHKRGDAASALKRLLLELSRQGWVL